MAPTISCAPTVSMYFLGNTPRTTYYTLRTLLLVYTPSSCLALPLPWLPSSGQILSLLFSTFMPAFTFSGNVFFFSFCKLCHI